jgi:hypothetical protein
MTQQEMDSAPAPTKKSKYREGDKCAHCGGQISPHGTFGGVIYWCDDCGSNNPSSPPNVNVELLKEAASD